MQERARLASVGFSVVIMLAGCAGGPPFVSPEPPREERAVVYVYRTSSLFGAGLKHDLSIDSRPFGRLVNGAHLRLELPTGEQFIDLTAVGCTRLKQPLLLRPGQTAYVQLALVNKTVTYGDKYYFDYGCELLRRTETEALPVITGLPRAD